MTSNDSISTQIKVKLRASWALIKSLQTGLLLLTGLAGYMSARCPVTTWQTLLGLIGSLFLAISGSTVLNMFFDRDIDALMERTCTRPLPRGELSPNEALILGLMMSTVGVVWAFLMDPMYGAIVFSGLFFDVVIYTIWLKRRTAWSIIWGGLAGGMPVLAGRVLGLGTIDWVGIALCLAVLFWIPTHIMTFNLRYKEDYERAQIPTFPSQYGEARTHIMIAVSSIASAIAMAVAAVGIGMTWGYLRVLAVLSIGLLLLAISYLIQPTSKKNFGLFKYASVYMMSSMLLVVAETM
ncbi:MAG: protoheme IX farnesyltransferase [Anaerolineales bacterium]|nr:protoheme IX farnesyltransferase [Anaerolineales bacterium]